MRGDHEVTNQATAAAEWAMIGIARVTETSYVVEGNSSPKISTDAEPTYL